MRGRGRSYRARPGANGYERNGASACPAFDAQSTSGEGMTPKNTVAAAARAVGTRIAGHRVPFGGPGDGLSEPAGNTPSASGDPPALPRTPGAFLGRGSAAGPLPN